ncbi:hypothetical protein BN903_1 [Halorubrum sp. AJ67]|nr:hypothetical protein BN903_1 [Halorubrum sp. AJ67]
MSKRRLDDIALGSAIPTLRSSMVMSEYRTHFLYVDGQ